VRIAPGASGRTESGAATLAAIPSASSSMPRPAPPADPGPEGALALGAPGLRRLGRGLIDRVPGPLRRSPAPAGRRTSPSCGPDERLTSGVGGEGPREVATPRLTIRGYPTITQSIHTRRAVLFGRWPFDLSRAALKLASSGRAGEG